MPMRFKDKIEGTITNADYASSAGSVAWGNVTGKPSTFAPSSHTHNYAGSGSAGGSANSAVKLDTATAGSATQPVYFSGGKPVAIGYTIQSSVPANAKFTDTNTTYDVFAAATSSAAGVTGLVPAPAAGQQGYYLAGDSTWKAFSKSTVGLGNVDNTADSAKSVKYATSAGSANAVAWGNVSGKPTTFTPASHTHNYAGSASAGGSANSAVKLDTDTAGSTTQPVYFTGGKPTAIGYTIQSNVPANAKFTDTTYSVFKAATTDAAGGKGLVPAPAKGQQGYYLAGDSTWKAFSKSTVGLGNVDNTADSAKSVKYATSAGSAGSASSATKATNDAKDQAITGYIRGLSVSGRTITYTKGDGTTGTITTQDTWRGIQDNLTSTATDQSLSAAQGKILNNSKAAMATLSNQDLNTITTPGFYNAGGGNTCTNKPSGYDNFGLIVTHNASGSYYLQIIVNSDGSSSRRACTNGTWGDWKADAFTDTHDWASITGKPSTFAPSSHTHNYAGSASAGGSANSAVKLDTATAGSTTQPVYFSGGKPVAIDYTIQSSVPANAKFTDTNTTYDVFKAATASAAGGTGLVPAPAAGQQNYFLRGDKTWQALSKSSVGLGNVDNTADSAKSVKYATSAGSANAVAWGNVSGKPTTFTPASHTHKYASGFSVSGTTVTVTYGDNTTSTFTTQDTNNTYGVFSAASSTAAGGTGLVPAPDKGQQGYYLAGDSTWKAFSKSTVGLGNVDNTADSAKSVKYATSAGSAGSASSATKATNDAKNQAITGYIRGLSVAGRVITYTKGDGTTGTITTQDTNSTYDVFAAATESAAGGKGLVPAPAKGDQAKFLKADGTWAIPNNTWRGIQDNLTSTATDQSLSANQGKVLKGLIDGKAASSHTHNYAGSASAGGSANSAVKLDTDTAGSTSQPVYFANGKPVAIGYTILSNVPANAKFTDTNTDTKVTQSAVAAADYTNWRPLVWGSSNSASEGFSPTTITDGVFVTSSISCQPSSGTIKATTFKGNLDGTASSANAVAWGNVSNKPSTFTPSSHTHKYASGFSVSGTTVTVTYGDNTTSTFTTQDTNTTYNVFTGATSSAAGGKGLVPAPAKGVTTQYLKSTGAWGDVAWGEISGKPSTFAPASHTHNYAGSASAGGSANSAVKLDTATAGSATQPVYFANGKPTACTYTLGKSVPSNAVFTDTHTLTLADRVSGTVVTCTAIPTT